jgi:pimeloyl-ACP methyl ester carboxylesterase
VCRMRLRPLSSSRAQQRCVCASVAVRADQGHAGAPKGAGEQSPQVHTRICAFVVLITHGFPSSVADFLQLIGPLVKPAAGQDFRVVALSLPGYAFSTPLTATGGRWAAPKRAWVELMRRLGYERYGVQGDVGAGVSGAVAAPTASM